MRTSAAVPADGGRADSVNAVLEAMAEEKKSQAAEAVSGVFSGIVDGLHSATGLSANVVEDLLLSGLVVLALWVIRLIVLQLVYRRTRDVRVRYQWRKSSAYVAAVLGAFLLLRVWLEGLGSLATFFGLLTAGVAIALKDPLANLAAWLFIVWRRPFAPGDRITIRDRTGDVIDQRVFMFTLLEVGTETGAGQSTGRLIHVPNGWIFTDAIVNFTRGFQYVWNEIAVLITFESDWRAAKHLLLDIAQEHGGALSEDAERKLRRAAQDYLIFYSKLTPTVYTSVKDSGVELTLRYLVEPRRRRGSEQQIWEAILDAFAANEAIDFAYPTTRYYHNASEGKPGARASSPHGDGQSTGLVQPTPPTAEPPDAL
ncbi:MAG: mechanosensitive ion channel family protein [Rhodothermaceae bacterium]|nr:mechanosensitive ion channel family protein [Rhodothermaceae bacterium]